MRESETGLRAGRERICEGLKMNRPTWLALMVLILASGLSAQPIKYFIENTGEFLHTTLHAKEKGKTYTIIGKSKNACLSILDQRDFDGNGHIDALIEQYPACGGNCCPNLYFFVSALGNGRFVTTDVLADSWGVPTVEKWNGHWSVVIVSSSKEPDADSPEEIKRRFILRDGNAVKVEESPRKEIPTLLDLRSEVFKGENDQQSIEFDLDGDGKKDTIGGTVWWRGGIAWWVSFANGRRVEGPGHCKRIGVLKTTTKGVHDLVCDQDTVIRWTGSAYSDGSKSVAQPSFDCAKATTKVELLICHDDLLAGLEQQMVAYYKLALKRLSPEGQAALSRDQAAWLREYSRKCNAAASDTERASCIGNALSVHVSDLMNRRQ
jgi:uncharacterized protein YecT (DUF1311 family)